MFPMNLRQVYKNYKRHGYKEDDKIRVENFRSNCMNAIKEAKENYLKNVGSQLADKNTTQKTYWKVLNRVMNKCKIPKIPPLLVNSKFIVNCKEKATAFNDYFSKQCKPNVNDSVLPNFRAFTDSRLHNIDITNDDIIAILKSLNPSKSCGPDNITVRMIILLWRLHYYPS